MHAIRYFLRKSQHKIVNNIVKTKFWFDEYNGNFGKMLEIEIKNLNLLAVAKHTDQLSLFCRVFFDQKYTQVSSQKLKKYVFMIKYFFKPKLFLIFITFFSKPS